MPVGGSLFRLAASLFLEQIKTMATRREGRALALLAGVVASVGLSGCMGQMGLSSMVTKGNLSVVDNRYGRAGVFILLSPVYGLAATADLFVFNTIEFWSGKNPITGKSPALVDQKLDALIKVNQHLDPSLNKVPLALLPQGVREVEVSYPDERTAQMEVHYLDGRSSLMRGEKRGELLDIYFDGRLVSTLTPAQLEEKARTGSAEV
ncbi:DUF3332 domain-containing protein [Aeromonas dhakensis]|uniref:DUF3332 domain-containing protein n=1 Tax=Aeromonas TaxID=642 RepID=UPI00043AF743|nr:DUF3332 domain-containing protein [Aeromonas dhakensis]AHV34383.1 hypothetical protein AI20_03980 [Aeromonas hydrophila YL17]QKG00508.1 DUF3332 domain-containing protein [Aeromonas hydrophila]MDH0174511.1 DUF3332 domain-containing protein [Aeromonas dhakensis]OBR45798.1 hypothetical protein A9196_14615 [Aeromonas dhakensis]RFS28560.1 DUF3332 domain-containing protein [Aeromonas dhakensis]